MVLSHADRLCLEASTLFRGTALESVAHLLTSCTLQDVGAETQLLRPGVENRCLYLIVSGELRVYLSDSALPTHAILGAGDCVGELSLIDGQAPSALVIAAIPTRLLAIPHDVLWAMVDHSHGIARNLLAVLSGRLRSGNLTLVSAQARSLEFEQSASVDPLTGLHNQRWMTKAMPRALHRCDRDGVAACMVIADIDGFSRFNERFGMLAGDAALREVAGRLADGLRAHDLIVRSAGEAFAILLPRTEIEEALLIAERLRERVANTPVDGAGQPHVLTISCGVAEHDGGESLDELLDRAGHALREAKDGGRDRVATAS